MNFDNKQEDIIKRAIKAETAALNSPKGQEIMQQLLDKAKEQNPNLTAEEWSRIKKNFLITIFNEIVKENPEFVSHFAKIVKDYIENERTENQE